MITATPIPVEPPPKSPPKPPKATEPTKPANVFSIGKLVLSRHKGTGSLTVTLPGPGVLALDGRGLARMELPVGAAGAVKVSIKASGMSSHVLKRKGRLKLNARITFTPTGGDPNTQTRGIRLIRV